MASPQQSCDSSSSEGSPRTADIIYPCTIRRGSVLIFTRLTLRLVTTSHFWFFFFSHLPSASISVLLCTSLPCCTTSSPCTNCSCPSVSSWARPALTLVSSCSTQLRQELLGPSRAPSPPAWQQTLPKAQVLSPGAGEGWILTCRGWLLQAPAPAPARPSTSLCITSSRRLQPTKADLLAENFLDHGCLLPTGVFSLHNLNFLADEGSLTPP